MKNKISLFLTILIISLFIIPQITLASWWNPGTWNIWEIFNRKSEVNIEQATTATSTLFKQIESTAKRADGTEEQEKKQELLIKSEKDKNANIVSSIKKDTGSNFITDPSIIPASTSSKTSLGGGASGIAISESRPVISNVVVKTKTNTFDENVIKSLFQIQIWDVLSDKYISWGTGIAIGGSGAILTNYHVAEEIFSNPNRYKAYACETISLNVRPNCKYLLGIADTIQRLLGNSTVGQKYNKQLDLALLYIDKIKIDNTWKSVLDVSLDSMGFSVVNLSSYTKKYEDLRIGDFVRAVGYPDYGGEKTIQVEGTVKSFKKDTLGAYGQILVMSDFKISHGNSGGPVFNYKGELVGVVVQCRIDSNKGCVSGLFIPLPTVNWWYTNQTNSEISTWNGNKFYTFKDTISTGVMGSSLCMSPLRQNAHYDPSVSVDSCTCNTGYSKDSNGECVNGSGFVDPKLRYGQKIDPEGEKQALLMLEGIFKALKNNSSRSSSVTSSISSSISSSSSSSSANSSSSMSSSLGSSSSSSMDSSSSLSSSASSSSSSSSVVSSSSSSSLSSSQSSSSSSVSAPVCYPSSCQLISDTSPQTSPRISGSNVIWQDSNKLSYINFITREQRIIVNSPVGVHEIDGNKVVYSMDSQIYFYDINTSVNTQITHISDGTGAGFPSINGNYISWSQSSLSGDHSIFLYNIATGETKQITGAISGGRMGSFMRPVVYNDNIVYEKINNNISDVYLYNISTDTASKIGNGYSPRIYGDYVLWFGSNSNPITLYKISNQTQKNIGEGGYVRMQGDKVVYWSSIDRNLHVHTISSGQTISGFGSDRGDGGGWTDPDIHGNTVVFGGNTGIYYVTLPNSQ